ncbi:MAG: hypothetical protein DWQ01_11445 [Planctomycetota bacterium]|nr:MAG: hypothetical protein DWQ01_11445 [Planctomycetota bacterium]
MPVAKPESRRLQDLVSVGPAIEAAFHELGIFEVKALIGQDADRLFKRLCQQRRERIDICCRDVFAAAIAQAEDPELPEEARQWWWWSRRRKANQA